MAEEFKGRPLSEVLEPPVPDTMAAADARVEREGLEVGSLWRHFKGGTYRVVGMAVLEEDCDPLVLYENVNNPGKTRARRLKVFTDVHPTHNVRRFTRLA